jgi:hypothetical protein
MSDPHSTLSDPLRGVIRPTPALPVRREQEKERRRAPATPRRPQTNTRLPDGTAHIDEYARSP